MNTNLALGTWAQISEGCPMDCNVDGSNLTHVLFGTDGSFELVFEAEALRAFNAASGRAVAEMDAIHEREEAERRAKPS